MYLVNSEILIIINMINNNKIKAKIQQKKYKIQIIQLIKKMINQMNIKIKISII